MSKTKKSDRSADQFAEFKEELVRANERQYGAEVRQQYGDQAMDESNAQVRSLTPEHYAQGERLRQELETPLQAALATGDPASALAQQACDLHRQWLSVYYPRYSPAYHRGLAEMYVTDARFRAYYDQIAPGCAEFLHDAIQIYCG